MTSQIVPPMHDIDTLILPDLIKKAAEYKGLMYDPTEPYSKPIVTCVLDQSLLAFLAQHNIKQQSRPDCNHEILTLIDENPQEYTSKGYAHDWVPSNYWNFRLTEEEGRGPTISLLVGFGMSIQKRGILLFPWTRAPLFSPYARLSQFRMFKAIVQSDHVEFPPIAHELAASNGILSVTWTNLGLGGIRSIHNLFKEFAGGNKDVLNLGRAQYIFDPHPYPLHREPKKFIPEPSHPQLFQQWYAQLQHYRSRLSI